MTKQALIIISRNPILGQCKTRLAKTIGNRAALDIYEFLLAHTAAITSSLTCDIFVYYSQEIWTNDVWNDNRFNKKLQKGDNLGSRMQNAFQEVFDAGYKNLICIGSDLYDLSTEDLKEAFNKLEQNEAILGPALDGGYYLLGLSSMIPQLFKNKQWGSDSVGKDTLNDLTSYKYELLAAKNDIDYYEDIKDVDSLMAFVPKNLHA